MKDVVLMGLSQRLVSAWPASISSSTCLMGLTAADRACLDSFPK